MKVYLQGPNGEEWELQVSEPDPADGTYTIDALEMGTLIDREYIEGSWIRIVP